MAIKIISGKDLDYGDTYEIHLDLDSMHVRGFDTTCAVIPEWANLHIEDSEVFVTIPSIGIKRHKVMSKLADIILYEFQLHSGSNPIKKSTDCTCGAKHTSNPKFHHIWCDLHKTKA
jgi:hypothetical protein